MWGLSLYSKVCEDFRNGRGEHPKVVFGRIAADVLARARERHARWRRCDDCSEWDECFEWMDGEKVEARLCKRCDEKREKECFEPRLQPSHPA
jgi:hypothetical protein